MHFNVLREHTIFLLNINFTTNYNSIIIMNKCIIILKLLFKVYRYTLYMNISFVLYHLELNNKYDNLEFLIFKLS